MKFFVKQFINLLLIVTIVFAGCQVNVFAAKGEEKQYLTDSILSEEIEWEPLQTDALYNISLFASDDLPTITDSEEVIWFDRLANRPLYAENFYKWLNNSSQKGGALINATETTLSNGSQAHLVTSFTATKSFKFSAGASTDVIKSAAAAAIEDELDVNFYSSSKWINETFACFDRDFPEIFWLGGSVSTSYASSSSIGYYPSGSGEVTYTQDIYFILKASNYDVRAEGYRNTSYITSDINVRDNSISTITVSVYEKSDYEKIKFFNNWLTVNNGYNANINIALPQARECISALQGACGRKAPVCESYARAFKVLCDESDIPCVLVSGDAGGPHMWNSVYLEGNWYAVDVTFNDPGYLKEGYPESGYENEDYLLVGGNTKIDGKFFGQSHAVENTVFSDGVAYINGPRLSDISYFEAPHICKHVNGKCIICSSICYDANNDNIINIIDFVELRNAFAYDRLIGNYDCNSDGEVNAIDMVYLRRKLWSIF